MINDSIFFFLEEAFNLSLSSFSKDIPVAALLIYKNTIISSGVNTVYRDNTILGHAEINSIQSGLFSYGNEIVSNCSLIITMEPCLMCMGVILNSHIKDIHFLIRNPKYGASLIGIDHIFYKTIWPLVKNYEFHPLFSNLVENYKIKLKKFFL